MVTLAYIAIGSNLDSPLIQADTAIQAIKKLPKSRVLTTSKYYRTQPLGNTAQPDYLNAAIALETNLNAYELLNNIQHIELLQGRERKNERWGPRTLDLDLMLFGNEIINTPQLIVPHYDMKNRSFMLWPLIEIAPQLNFPNGESLRTILMHLGQNKPSFW